MEKKKAPQSPLRRAPAPRYAASGPGPVAAELPGAQNNLDALLAAAAVCRGLGIQQDLTQQTPGVGAAPALEADPLSPNNGGLKLRIWVGFLFGPSVVLPSLQPFGRPMRASQHYEELLLPYRLQPECSALHRSQIYKVNSASEVVLLCVPPRIHCASGAPEAGRVIIAGSCLCCMTGLFLISVANSGSLLAELSPGAVC